MTAQAQRLAVGVAVLTPTDTHYVAGLLTLASCPQGVEVEVGSMVPDVAAGIARDVDVTVRGRDSDGRDIILIGREVKAHSRPLDSTHVEQLACKLNDMPDLGTRGIVSASGYTAPAIRKAAKHGIVLFELVELSEEDSGFQHFRVAKMPFTQSGLEWNPLQKVHVNPHRKATAEEKAMAEKSPVTLHGNRDPDCPNFGALLRLVQRLALIELMKGWPEEAQVPGTSKTARVLVNVAAQEAIVSAKGRQFTIDEILFSGVVRWREETRECPFMILRRVGAEKPDAGCSAFEAPGWGLCGLVVSNSNREIRFMRIPVTDRNKKKVYRQVLRHIIKPPPASDSGSV